MSLEQPSNQTRIAGYLDMLLVDHSVWDEKLSLAINPPIRPLDTVAPGRYVLTTEKFGSGHRVIKYTHLLNSLSILNTLPSSRLKSEVFHRCLPLAAEAMLCD
jgi:hypothetical protein